MAREYARWNVAASGDDDWRALPWPAQWLYKTLWDHPKLTYCGVIDWRLGRIAAAGDGMDAETVRNLARCLEARLFVVIDDDTEELLIRSWARFDGLMRQPRMAVSFATAFAAVESATIRGVLIHEVHKIRDREPHLAGWAKPAVADLLDREGLDPRSRALPADPFTAGFHLGFGPVCHPVSVPFGPNASQALGLVSVPPTPAPAPTPLLPPIPVADATDDDTKKKSRRKPERPLPASWKPNATHYELAIHERLDIEAQVKAFRNHAETHDRRARDWDAAFRTWLNRANDMQGRPSRPSNPRRNVGVDQWLA